MRAMDSPRQMRFPVSTGEGRKVSHSCTGIMRSGEPFDPH